MNIVPHHHTMDPMQVAQVFVQSGMFPDAKSVATAASKLIVGRGLGLTDYDSMAGLHIIKGKVVLASNTMAAAIKASGKYDYSSTTTESECTITFYLVNNGKREEIGSTTFSMEDAQNAGLRGDNWKKWPKAMLFARAISAGYREHCPDALGAAPVYVQEHGESEIAEDPKQLPAPIPVIQAAPREWVTRVVGTVEAEMESDGSNWVKFWGLDGEDEFILYACDEVAEQVKETIGTKVEMCIENKNGKNMIIEIKKENK